ncbi:hypothetical protein Ga0100230_002150 [Opitutaceae bacterium TAV3]|nr:hypothetical protein Ga0100230_002150 [Opitutaceae bacterium TAV3]
MPAKKQDVAEGGSPRPARRCEAPPIRKNAAAPRSSGDCPPPPPPPFQRQALTMHSTAPPAFPSHPPPVDMTDRRITAAIIIITAHQPGRHDAA